MSGIFVPGGHPPMVDLMQDPDLGEVLRHFHKQSKPTALLCHGPIAVTAAMPNAREFRQALVEGNMEAAKSAAEGWQYTGYRMTIFSNDEEHYVEENVMGGSKVPFYVASALEIAGGKVETKGIFEAQQLRIVSSLQARIRLPIIASRTCWSRRSSVTWLRVQPVDVSG